MKREFQKACTNGNLQNAKIIYYFISIINIQINYDDVFMWTCIFGKLNIMQWLLQIKPDINVFNIDITKCPFKCACERGYLHIAQWLLSVKPTIDVSSNDEYAFVAACVYGQLPVAKWLLSVKPTINVFINKEKAFLSACINGYLSIAEWLCTLNPFKYSINSLGRTFKNSNKTINSYIIPHIRPQKQSIIIALLSLLKTKDYTQHLTADLVYAIANYQ